MALASTGTITLEQVISYWHTAGAFTPTHDLNWFSGRQYYSDGGGLGQHFPTVNLHLGMFYGTSPVDEWSQGGSK